MQSSNKTPLQPARVEPSHAQTQGKDSLKTAEKKASTNSQTSSSNTDSNLWNQLFGYFVIWLLMMLSVPFMRDVFYDNSKVWMRQMAPYKTDNITLVMQVLSVIGDGEGYGYFIMIFNYGQGQLYEYIFFSLTIFLNLHTSNALKQGLHDSRPQFDDPQLAHENYGDCAGEFGNPSGHALLSTQFALTVLLFYKEKYADYFQSHKMISYFCDVSCIFFIIIMGFSRFYLGRHSIDQIILGTMLGVLNSHFFQYCMKPHMFDPTFKPGAQPLSPAKHWRNFYISLFIWAVLVSQVTMIYIYVDNNIHIPDAWMENMKQLCTKGMRLTESFHHQNMAIEGFIALLPAHYFWVALKHSTFGKQFYVDISDVQHLGVGWSEFAFKMIMALTVDEVLSTVIPMTFFGTKDLPVFTDFVIKRCSIGLWMSSIALSPIDNYLQKLFRTPKLNQNEGKDKQE